MKHTTDFDPPATVLIVDDVMANIQVMAAILDHAGYDIQFATSGAKIFDTLAVEEVDLILLDIMMPGMDGYEVCRRLKADPATADIPVVFVSAKNTLQEKLQGFEAGAVDYITKPFELQEVLVRVATHVKLRRTTRELSETNQHLEDILNSRTRELVRSERQAAFGQLVQGIVHNLRGPLSASTLGLDLLEQLLAVERAGIPNGTAASSTPGSDTDARIRKTFTLMRDSHDAMAHMLSSLLAKSRSDRDADARRFDLNELVRRELEFFHADRVFRHGIARTIELADEPLLIHGVPSEIAQAIINLVRNALDAMSGLPDPALTVATTRTDEHATVLIADNGPGIPNDLRDRIFDPFFTTKPAEDDPEYKGDGPTGTGLGLWTVQEAVNSAGGTITVHSKPGEGASFELRFPLHDESGSGNHRKGNVSLPPA